MGAISNATVAATPLPLPVSRKTDTTSATVLNASPALDAACARNSLRNPWPTANECEHPAPIVP